MKSLNDAPTLGQFVRNLKEGVYITSAAGQILDANPAFLEMLGVTSLADLDAHTAASLLVNPCRREEETALLQAHGAIREFELEILRPDGQRRTVLDTAYQVVDPDSGDLLYHGILVDISDRKRLEQQLRDMAVRDPLTGCLNRRHLQSAIADLDAGETTVGVVVVDIDHFKSYNDSYGHDMGDRLLVQVGRFLSNAVRTDDAVIRTGGDEFAILLPDAGLDATDAVVTRLKAAGPESAPVSFTVGWAVRRLGEPVEETFRRADHHLIRVRVKDRALRPRD
jgi:diguanylate cyclase (GGDEF)-like protein/PAS domain S-box-containing protein